MLPLTRFLILIVAIAGGMVYKKVNDLFANVKAPILPVNQWWGDEEEPTNWQVYLDNSSEIISNKLYYPDQVNLLSKTTHSHLVNKI